MDAVLVYGPGRDWRRLVQRSLDGVGVRVLLASSIAEAAKCLAAGGVRLVVLADDAAARDAETLRAAVLVHGSVERRIVLVPLPPDATPADVLGSVRAALTG